jgi:hypothetical protein
VMTPFTLTPCTCLGSCVRRVVAADGSGDVGLAQ